MDSLSVAMTSMAFALTPILLYFADPFHPDKGWKRADRIIKDTLLVWLILAIVVSFVWSGV